MENSSMAKFRLDSATIIFPPIGSRELQECGEMRSF